MVSGTNDPTISSWGNIGLQDVPQGGYQTNAFTGFVDSSSSLGGVWGREPYLQNIEAPVLKGVVHGLSDTPPNVPHGETQYTPTHAFYDAFTGNLEELIDKYGLSEEQVNQLVMAHMTEMPADDTFINQVLNELNEKVADEMAEMFDLPSTTDQGKNLKERASTHAGKLKDRISALQAYAASLPKGSEKQAIQQQIKELSQNLDGFNGLLSSLPESPSREQLAKLAQELGQSGEQLSGMAGKLSKLAENNPELQSILSDFEFNVNESVNSLDGLLEELQTSWELSTGNFNALTGGFKETFANRLTRAFDKAFESALEAFTDDPELQAKLRFAHYNPDAEIPGDAKKLAKQVEQAAVNQLNAEEWALPKGYTPPANGSSYFNKMQTAADDAFEAALENYVGEDGEPLTPEQQNQIRNIYYGVIAPSGDLGAISAELEAMVAAEMAIAFGLPEGFPVPKGSVSHAANINGQFQMKFLELVNSLSPEQKKEIFQAINDPLNPNITAATKALLNKLFNQAAGAIRAQFGLPESWMPSTGVLKEIATMTPRQQLLAANMTELENQVSLAISYVEQWPNNPSKAVLLNVLKIISDAISRLKAQVAVMIQLDAELATKIGKAQLDAALFKVDEHLRKLEKIQKKQAKQKSLAPMMKAFKIIALVVTVLMTGPILSSVMIADVAANGLDSEKSWFNIIFKTVGDGVTSLLADELGFPKELALIVSMIVMAMVCVGLAACGGGPFGGLTMFFEHSGVIQSIFTDIFGCDPMVGEIIAMCTQMVVDLVIMVLLAIITAGAGTTLLVATITARVAQATGRAVEMIAKALTQIARAVAKIAQAASRLSKFAGKVMRVVSKAIKFFAKQVQKWADDMMDWAQEVNKLSATVSKEAGKMKWTKQLKAMLKGGKTGRPGFDDAIKGLKKQIDITKWFFRGVGGVFTGLQLATVAVQVNNSFVAAQIARIRGDLEAMMTELEAFIKTLKKMIAKILEGLSGQADWLSQIGMQQGTMWKEYSQTMDAVAVANQAS